MLQRTAVIVAGIALVTVFLPATAAQGVSPVGPITNPDFEAGPTLGPAQDTAEGSPADECVGVGHQALYGSGSPQGTATGGSYGSPDPSNADPHGAVAQVQEDPEGEAEFAAGYGHCEWSSQDGYDLAWVHPVARAQQPAHWSMDIRNPSVDFGHNFDDDPFDREVKFLADASASGHNLWQWMGSPHQAFTPNAEAFSLDIEAGSPERGVVTFVLTTVPMETQGESYYKPCRLVFTAEQIADAAGEDGHAEVSPLDGRFVSRDSSCDALEQKWDGGTDAEKREVLGSTRITQFDFWGWNRNPEPVVVDNVQLVGATTVAESLADGNARANPTVTDDEVGVRACSSHTGADGETGQWSAGATVHTDEPGAEATEPDPGGVAAEADSLATNLQGEGTFGTSVTHVSLLEGGEETAGTGTDDLPGAAGWNGGGDGQWSCGEDGPEHRDDGAGAPEKPFDDADEILEIVLP